MRAQGQPHPGEVRAGTLVRYRVFQAASPLIRRDSRDAARRSWASSSSSSARVAMIVVIARPVGVAALDALTREWLQESQ
jgi:hypothetical protein